jgi:RNA polymerase sigma-70 factor (ECF subfamily)
MINVIKMDRDKFNSVIKDNKNLIFKICYTYCSNPENRRDLQQEILLQLWKAFSKFDGRVKISTWIYRIALNTAISFYRNDYKHYANKATIDISVISIPDSNDGVELEENIEMLYKFIGNLKDLDKALILLYLDDYKYQDIAKLIGITETNVATKINRIKKILKEQFNNN